MAYLAQTVSEENEKSRFNLNHAAILLLITCVLRWPVLGDPNYHIDESFYRLVADQMHQGAIPYVDIWDRKPVGLFIIYWFIAFFGDVLAYQIAAGICVWLTAICIAAIAKQYCSTLASLMAATVYITTLGALAGSGGQSPVFYNLLIACAAWLTHSALNTDEKTAVIRKGFLAMLLCGLAITVKQTSAFEGAAFGLILLYKLWREWGYKPALKWGVLFALLGLLPTAMTLCVFFTIGHGHDYLYATMQTIFLTAPISSETRFINAFWLIRIMGPMLCIALLAILISVRQKVKSWPFVATWTGSAMLGFLSVPNWFDHYALPLAAPLALLSAFLFDRKPVGIFAAGTVFLWLIVVSGYPQTTRTVESQNGMATAVNLINRHKGNGCLFVYDASPALYVATKSCLPTRFVFPEHLSNAREAKAIGVNTILETQRILSSRPSVIAIAKNPTLATPNLATRRLIRSKLNTSYKIVGTIILTDVVKSSEIEIWALDSST
jgi:Dolichyl-phosphate-mannose-protein mannosyltransferase